MPSDPTLTLLALLHPQNQDLLGALSAASSTSVPPNFLTSSLTPGLPSAWLPNADSRRFGTNANEWKDTGYLGPLPVEVPHGRGTASEYSIPFWERGKLKGPEIPVFVPGLTHEEVIDLLTNVIPNEGKIPKSILDKALVHAQERIAQGLSPFYGSGLTPNEQKLPADSPYYQKPPKGR